MKKENNLGFKVKEYLFHLNNANDENGIRPAEGWKFACVDLAGRQEIEHAYYPVVGTEIGAAEMDGFTERVMLRLISDHPKIHVADKQINNSIGAGHFVAFCANRARR